MVLLGYDENIARILVFGGIAKTRHGNVKIDATSMLRTSVNDFSTCELVKMDSLDDPDFFYNSHSLPFSDEITGIMGSEGVHLYHRETGKWMPCVKELGYKACT